MQYKSITVQTDNTVVSHWSNGHGFYKQFAGNEVAKFLEKAYIKR